MSEYTVDPWNNFCRVFELPEKFPSGHCFGGGLPVTMKMVDWFYPTTVPQAGVSKEIWVEKFGAIDSSDTQTVTEDELKLTIIPFLKVKNYMRPNREYLILFDFGCAITFKMEE